MLLLFARPTHGFTGISTFWSNGSGRPFDATQVQVTVAQVPRDLDAIRQCRAAVLKTSTLLESQRRFFNATAVADGKATCFIGRDKSSRQLVGMVDVVFRQGNEVAFINNVFVTPEARGRGIGRTLMQGVEAGLRDTHVQILLLDVYVSNTPALSLYRSCGYHAPNIHGVLAKIGELTGFPFQIQMKKVMVPVK